MDTKKIARERIERLFELADEIHEYAPEYADKYVERAKKIGMRSRVRIPEEYKRRFCSECGSFLVYGKNARVRTDDGKVVITCDNCGHHDRYPY